jgi:predicted HAD superfamily phosphohydrolase
MKAIGSGEISRISDELWEIEVIVFSNMVFVGDTLGISQNTWK